MYRKPIVVGLAAAAVVLSGGGAYAYWTTTGSGHSTATVATIKPLDIKAVDVVGLVMGRSAPLTGKISNPNDSEMSLIGTHITVKLSLDRRHVGCGPENFKVTPPSTKATKVPAHGSVNLEPGSMTMLNTTKDQSACQGATVTLDYLLK